MLLSRLGALSTLVEDDAPIYGSGGGAPPRKTPPPRPTLEDRKDGVVKKDHLKSKVRPKIDKASVTRTPAGLYSTNRAGTGLCRAFNEGNCPCDKVGPDGRCTSGYAHQCSKCLDNHSAANCTAQPRDFQGGKGKGKGKGGGKGKGHGGK